MNQQTNRLRPIEKTLRKILVQAKIATQEQICSELQIQGYDVNQSKVSRLLRKLDAVKSKNEQGVLVYRLSKEPAPPTNLSPLYQTIIDIRSNEQLIVVQTSPGAASVIARILDYNAQRLEIIGTVAGDDIVLVIPSTIADMQKVIQQLEKILLKSHLD